MPPARPGESAGNPRAPKDKGAKPKRRYHHGDLRRALIDDAVGTIARQGIGALNLRQLAARVGVTSGAPYHHFANREALLAAIADDGFRRLEARLIAARDAAPLEAGARLEALGEAYVRIRHRQPRLFPGHVSRRRDDRGPDHNRACARSTCFARRCSSASRKARRRPATRRRWC